jgi:hypothetical protein
VAWVNVPGSCASHVTLQASNLVPRPAKISAASAAAALYQGMTAHYLAHDVFALAEGHMCLVHSAAGGVGQMLCQIARLRGATVFATVSARTRRKDHGWLVCCGGGNHCCRYEEVGGGCEIFWCKARVTARELDGLTAKRRLLAPSPRNNSSLAVVAGGKASA